jgi:hypothetical protein
MNASFVRTPARAGLIATAAAAFCAAPGSWAAPGVPLGAQFRVDSVASPSSDPVVARDAAGDFVVVWTTTANQPGLGFQTQVYARLFGADGTPQGPEFPVSPSLSDASNIGVAMDAAGDFAVSWVLDDADGRHIVVQRVAAGGALAGTPIQVATIGGVDGYPALAMDADGDFVVAWSNIFQHFVPLPNPSGYGELAFGHSKVLAQRYARDGLPQGGPVLVDLSFTNPTPLSGLYEGTPPSVAMDSDGDFVVAWPDHGLLGGDVVKARSFKADGSPAGLAFRADPVTGNPVNALQPAVGMAANGDFQIAWLSSHAIGGNSYSGYDIYVRRYASSGRAQGAPLQVNHQLVIAGPPGLAVNPAGASVFAWTGTTSGFCCVPADLAFQLYAADGTVVGSESIVASTPSNGLGRAAVATDSLGNFVVTWNQFDSIQARLYTGQ